MAGCYRTGELVCAGCGRRFVARIRRDRPVRYCTISCASTHTARRGAANVMYNGGLSRMNNGRAVIVCRDGTLMLYYRGVMAAHIGRLLREDEIVHHVNGDQADDRIENLQITTRAEHMNMHRVDLMRGRGYGN